MKRLRTKNIQSDSPPIEAAVVEFVRLFLALGFLLLVLFQLHETVREEQVVDEDIEPRVVLIQKLMHLIQSNETSLGKVLRKWKTHGYRV